MSELVDTNMCCVCYVLYSEDVSGEEWIECGCGHWLHEECAEDCYVDNSGKEKFVLFVSDFIHFTMFSSVMFSCFVAINKRFFKHSAYRCVAIFVLNSVVCVI